MMHPQVFSQQYQLLLLVLSTVSNSQVCHHHTNHYLLRTHKSNLSHFQPFLPVTLPAKISQVLQQYSHCIFHQGILPLFILLLPVASQWVPPKFASVWSSDILQFTIRIFYYTILFYFWNTQSFNLFRPCTLSVIYQVPSKEPPDKPSLILHRSQVYLCLHIFVWWPTLLHK